MEGEKEKRNSDDKRLIGDKRKEEVRGREGRERQKLEGEREKQEN